MSVTPTKVVFTVAGMDCAHCVRAVDQAIRALPGIEHIAVSLASNEAVVTRSLCGASDAAIIEAIENAGYDVVR